MAEMLVKDLTTTAEERCLAVGLDPAVVRAENWPVSYAEGWWVCS